MWAYGNVTLNSSMQAKGYNGYTTSAVKSKARLLYGYSEVRAKVGTSKISSAFWFNYNDGNTWTEIDIFEAFGPVNDTPYFYDQVKSHTHIFKLNGDSNINDLESKCHCQSGIIYLHIYIPSQNTYNIKYNTIYYIESNSCTQGNLWTPPNIPNLSNDWHVYGMNWTSSSLKIYFDNTLVWDIENSCLHQGLQLNFDRETMPNWVGLPSYSALPDTPFMIDYVRTWTN